MSEPDLHDLLIAEASRQRPKAAPPYASLAGRARARRRTRRATLAVMAATVASAAIALPMILTGSQSGVPSTTTGAIGTSASGSPGRSAADPLQSTFTGFGMTFRYPSAWRSQPYQVVSSFSGLITYLSTETLHNPCTTHSVNAGTEVDCGWPIGHLGPNDVLITWNSYGMPGHRLTAPNTTVGGHPATVHSGPADDPCAKIGGMRSVDAAITQNPTLAPSGGNDNLIQMSACISGPGTDRAEADVIAMLDSVHFWG